VRRTGAERLEPAPTYGPEGLSRKWRNWQTRNVPCNATPPSGSDRLLVGTCGTNGQCVNESRPRRTGLRVDRELERREVARASVHHLHADVTENLGEAEPPVCRDRVDVLPTQVRLDDRDFGIAHPLGAGEGGTTVQAGEEVRHGRSYGAHCAMTTGTTMMSREMRARRKISRTSVAPSMRLNAVPRGAGDGTRALRRR